MSIQDNPEGRNESKKGKGRLSLGDILRMVTGDSTENKKVAILAWSAIKKYSALAVRGARKRPKLAVVIIALFLIAGFTSYSVYTHRKEERLEAIQNLAKWEEEKIWAYNHAIKNGASVKWSKTFGAYYASYRVFDGDHHQKALEKAILMANLIHKIR